MSQPIDVGSVLSGRYQVTEFVLTSAEGDMVLGGIDQVLNRSVSILVAATAHASQLASSSREIAMDERQSKVQVLDLGITDDNETYLVANVAQAHDLLDLVRETADAPYVEPFFTDTLGTEIFGVSRQPVPQTYDSREDDEQRAYAYEEYDDESEHRGLGAAFSNGITGLKNRFHRTKDDEIVTAAPSESPATARNEQVAPTPDSDDREDAPREPARAKVTRIDDEPAVTATAALNAAEMSRGGVQTPATQDDEKPQKKKAAAVTGVAAVGAAAALAKKRDADKERENRAKAAAAAGAGAGAAAGAGASANGPSGPTPGTDEDEESENKPARLLIGAALLAVLVLAVVFAFNFLGGGDKEPVAKESNPTESSQNAEEPNGESEPKEEELPVPEIGDISRLVPGNQSLNAETDGTLSKMVDGNPASAYRSFTFTTPDFGGLASNMAFIVELEDESKIEEITLEGLNASGGSYEILTGNSDDLGEAKSVATGSFTGPSVSVSVKDDDEASEAQYVFLDVTELPRRAADVNPSRPYGIQIGEISVK